MSEPFVSVIVAARNAQNTLEKCLDSILNLDYPTFEVIVVNDGSYDKTEEILKKYSGKIMSFTNPVSVGPAKARNMAAELARGSFLCFTDADCVVNRSWVRELLAGFCDATVVSVGGRQEIPENETPFGRKVASFMKKTGFVSDYARSHFSGIVPVRHNASCNVMYRKDAFLNAGGFLEGLWPGEDVELDYRFEKEGQNILCNSRAVVKHYRPTTWRSFARMMFRYGWAQGFLVRKYGIFRKIQALPFIFFGLLFWFIFFVFQKFSSFLTILGISLLAVGAWIKFDFTVFILFWICLFCWNAGFLKGASLGRLTKK
ncbi:MAG: glycosyltransferase [Candidatus Omnitrophota bacterium]